MRSTNPEAETIEKAEILAATSEIVPTGSGGLPAAELVDWKGAMRRAVRCPHELRRVLGLPPAKWRRTDSPSSADDVAGGAHGDSVANDGGGAAPPPFPTFVPLEYLTRIRPGDPDDPLLRQVLPLPEEAVADDRFVSDPVGDLAATRGGGVLQKYAGRALVISTGACGIHCRYCFRREFPYADVGSRREAWRPAIEEIAHLPEIDEVILSGGDPLTVDDQPLSELVESIAAITHVRRLRIHSRMPIVIPQRVTESLLELLCSTRLAVWMVVHVNHPRELDENTLAALSRLVDRGIPVLNQAVLLRGVNDRADVLIDLCRRLVDHRIQPYYLHQLDRVRGAAHFEVSIEEGKALIGTLRATLPGYAVPRYVAEHPGETSKRPLE